MGLNGHHYSNMQVGGLVVVMEKTLLCLLGHFGNWIKDKWCVFVKLGCLFLARTSNQ